MHSEMPEDKLKPPFFHYHFHYLFIFHFHFIYHVYRYTSRTRAKRVVILQILNRLRLNRLWRES